MKNMEIIRYKEFPWGSIVEVKSNGKKEYLVNARIQVVVGSLLLVAVVFAYLGNLLGKII